MRPSSEALWLLPDGSRGGLGVEDPQSWSQATLTRAPTSKEFHVADN